ncbi:Sapep family Mn(2+)-dependent dipeptidase [Acetobacterium woodii]|uniref:Xaa-His dipeptidase n=1 Tax=Acetobacterium woodii (strain ATCC 29683 / DSM 1030 / JCM 2381 / KCTC 1655 / WB1) TaxID=931626 RepID=H6LEX2_ACEWD|nr:Sapep family Mn(2+)-dependent dipeptidase [Acetobacterium woodii]AFA46878.1 xaa-His dipeptidase [Acetobacterium woodii DSM 1030]
MNYNLNEKKLLSDLKGLLQIDSTNADAGAIIPEAPLGTGINNAINYVLALGKSFGFKTKNCDGYCGYIEMGQGEEMIGILTHVDTVPVGTGWSVNPFDLTIDGDKAYGRGTIDDKGPTMVALYAMKALAESGVPINKRVRLIIGGDEEGEEWHCMNHYKLTEEPPTYAFSPDSGYPAIFAEKGILNVCIKKKLEPTIPELGFFSGSQINTVPDYAKAIVRDTVYESIGKPAHASQPQEGINAMFLLTQKLRTLGVEHPFLDLVEIASSEGLNIDVEDEISGKLTINPSIANVNQDKAVLKCDIRYPVTMNGADIRNRIAQAVRPLGFDVNINYDMAPLHLDKESYLIEVLQKIYEDYTGDKSGPKVIGGGTYARAFDNAVAFGGRFPEEPNTCHQTDEYWSIKSMRKNFDIIAKALESLVQ